MGFTPSGEQFEMASGQQRATIVEVGGGVREYSVGARAVPDPYPPGEICDGAHGAPLIPWPNRLADGRYNFDGADLQVALTEPTKQNAIHGFLRWRPWVAVEREEDRVVMGTRLYPLEGYPFALEVRVAYELNEAGLVVSTTALNIGERRVQCLASSDHRCAILHIDAHGRGDAKCERHNPEHREETCD